MEKNSEWLTLNQASKFFEFDSTTTFRVLKRFAVRTKPYGLLKRKYLLEDIKKVKDQLWKKSAGASDLTKNK